MKKLKGFLIFILIIAALVSVVYFVPSVREKVYEVGRSIPVIQNYIPREEIEKNVENKEVKQAESKSEKIVEKPKEVEKITASGINDEINYILAEKLAQAHNITFNEDILAEYTKTIFKNTPPQTPDTIEGNPKTLVAIVGYKEYGKSLALDYVIQEIVNKTAVVKEEDKVNEELIKTLLEKYKGNEKLSKATNDNQRKEIALKLNAEDNVRNFLEMEMKSMSGEVYTDLLKKYNPEYYNSVQKGNPIEIYDYHGQKPSEELTDNEVKDIISSQYNEQTQTGGQNEQLDGVTQDILK